MSESIRTISELLSDVRASLTGARTSVGDVLEAFHERGFGFLLFLIALPMALPIPVPPGVNVLLAAPLLLLTAQQAVGRHTIWLPEGVKRRSFDTVRIAGLIDGLMPWARKLEILVKPRLGFVTRGVFSPVIGVLGFVMALSICVPLPLTNTVPSFGIALMAVGVLMRDGLAVLAGAVIGTAWVLLLGGVVIFLGVEGIDLFKETIKSYL